MATVPIEEAGAKLSDLIHGLLPGEELVITENDRPIARLVGFASRPERRVPGSARGKLVIHAEDDEHLDGFKDYMP